MGAHSTLYVSPKLARKKLLVKILEADYGTLEQLMDVAFSSSLYNFSVFNGEASQQDQAVVESL